MTSRAQLLAYVAYGLSLMATQQYQTAITDSFTPVMNAIEANQPKAAVVINVLKGSAAFSTYNALAAVSSPRERAAQDALNTAESSFKAAYDLNPDYSRALLGLASAKFLRLTNLDDPSLNTMLTAFSDILADYDKAANAKDQPPSAEIPTKVAFGKGQVYRLMYALTLNDDAYQAGTKALTKVIDAGKANTSPQLREIVARAYALRGGLSATKAMFDASVDGYDSAIKDYSAAEKLSEVAASQALYRRQGIRAQFDQAVLQGDAVKFEAAFSQFAALTDPAPPAAELAGMWHAKGQYYANNGRTSDAISAYTSALKLDLTNSRELAASLWFDFGNANDAQCHVEAAVSAFTQTIALDGKNPNYRRLPALIKQYARQSCF
jgi:tetratricopeptide (TPR) repeat protein